MKKTKFLIAAAIIGVSSIVAIAADHIDAPAVTGGTNDITDFYAFQGQNTSNLVLVANVQGLLSPSSTANATFDENTLIEFNIDTNNDNVEDLVIQATPRNGIMYFFGPAAPLQTGLDSTILTNDAAGSVEITAYGQNAITATENGMQFFAGPRDDPFFFDSGQYNAIIDGMATSFNNPGNDSFAGTNVLSVVVEVPKSLVGGSGTINTWVESKRRQ
ncbi:DUF4331 family protein [Winogradskyella haliclonae]|uniref:DUF4331 domain-containing protein n=1 Tax=Winogradskyella haliclonae TaxID=2048558 RepID=A0ABQ2C0X7_9FLAO|nr:DUF4331 family protein [Winogradskyella haliclonae]GGI57999.1 hypothetical protein GCM10011444_23080 [Winogradskyella haliclonae]